MTVATAIPRGPVFSKLAVSSRADVPSEAAVAPKITVPPAIPVPSVAPRRYALRPVVVAACLDDLRGPAGGLAELPQRLFWSGMSGHVFDLSDRDQALEAYEAVLDAARTQADLGEHLNRDLLALLWPDLVLSARVRGAWEAGHPALAATVAAA